MEHRDSSAVGPPGPESGANRGIYMTGGTIGAVALGKGAKAKQMNYGAAASDPLEMIDRLLSKLEAEAVILEGEQAEDVIDDVQRLHTEVHSRRPSAEGIRSMLSRLTKATSSTATLLATVDQIKDLVTVLLH
jgi:hypothetical protein